MTASIDYLPIWKKNATGEERLQEIALVAGKFPERFGKMIIVYQETLPNGNTKVRYICGEGTTTNDTIAILESAKVQLIEWTSKV